MEKANKTISILLILLILLVPSISRAETLDIFAEGAILIDAKNSQVLYEKNPDKKLYPASTTKIMTAILAIEHANLDDIVTVDQEVVDLTYGSHIALEVGEQLTMEQLLYALMIESANDSALAIAKHVSGNIDVFVQLMNSKAKELGAENTNFVNPNGLHHDDHVTTARDLALIGQYAMKNDIFRSIVKEYIYQLPATNKKTEPRFFKSANRLVYSTIQIDVDGEMVPSKYEGANGIKTGYTKKSQNCLVSSVERSGRHLIAVVLNSNSQNVFSDSHKLYNYGFDNMENINLGWKDQFIDNFTIKDGLPSHVAGVLDRDLSYNIHSKEMGDIEERIIEKEIKLPIKAGDSLASIEYYINDNKVGQAEVLSTMDVLLDESTLLHNRLLNRWYLFVFAILILNQLFKYRKRLKIVRQRRKKKDNI